MKKVINDNKGYMLVEIIVASAIAITMAFFLMEMTLKVVNKNNDYYVESVLLFDKNIVTKEIMDDINSKKLVGVERIDDRTLILTYDDNTTRNLSVNGNTISYGDYKKKLANELNVEEPVLEPKDNTLIISINAYTNYSKEDYGIKIVVPYSDIEITYPTISKCYDILDNSGINNLDYAVRYDTPILGNATSEGEHGIYEEEDDLGISCYFRGDIDYNYVKFGKNSSGFDMYWRIIRINGDGSIRMIYDGTQAHANSNSSEDRHLENIKFTENHENSNGNVGYMYGRLDADDYQTEHENLHDNAIKEYIDDWYEDVFLNTTYEEKISDAIYCNDRKYLTDNNIYKMWLGDEWEDFTYINYGYDNLETLYGLNNRITFGESFGITESINPTLKCEQINDRFTLKNSVLYPKDGEGTNEKLTYPIGLITADELIFGGGYRYTNSSFEKSYTYLYNGNKYFWTMTAGSWVGGGARMFVGYNGGVLDDYSVLNYFGVRPVISLKKGVLQYGTGTSSDPFRVE